VKTFPVPSVQTVSGFALIGNRLTMSFEVNRTGELWRSFMPRRKEISGVVSPDVISLQVYPKSFDFSPTTNFEKWAGVEVKDFSTVPDGMESLSVPSGLYAIFHYKGSSTDISIFEFIFKEWLPSSGCVLDDRPHFERLGEKYKNASPDSEEDIFVPIKKA
jgi:AraC family transcriptional regulator